MSSTNEGNNPMNRLEIDVMRTLSRLALRLPEQKPGLPSPLRELPTKFIVVLALVVLALAAPAAAQSVPNRAAEVSQLVAAKFAVLLNGDDNRRRDVLGLLCGDLNLIDAGRWGLLLKTERNPPFTPADILVWAPTLEHVDVLTDAGPAWEVHPPIQATWRWLACPTSVAAEPHPIVGTPPPTGNPDLAAIRSLLEAQPAQMRLQIETALVPRLERIETKIDNAGISAGDVGRWLMKFAATPAGGILLTYFAMRGGDEALVP
jgi:hypothetical protein